MFNKIKNLFKRKDIRWVSNTEIKYENLEAEMYLLIENGDEIPMLFTKAEVARAKNRGLKNLEDTSWK